MSTMPQGTEAKVAAGPAVSIEEIWKETATILDTEPAKGGLLPLPDAPAPEPAGSICNLVFDDDAELILSSSAPNARMSLCGRNIFLAVFPTVHIVPSFTLRTADVCE